MGRPKNSPNVGKPLTWWTGIIKCAWCGKEREKRIHRDNWGVPHFCDNKCHGAYVTQQKIDRFTSASRTCRGCGKTKPTEELLAGQYVCRECAKVKRLANREHINRTKVEYNKQHRDSVLAQRKKSYYKHRVTIGERQRLKRLTDPEFRAKEKEKRKKQYEENRESAIIKSREIIPCTAFRLDDPVEQKKCFHYSNLQPLWAKENMAKGNRLPDGTRPSK